MPILFKESGVTGPSGNLGGAILGSNVNEAVNQWYNAADDAERVAGSVKYRCCYIQNTEAGPISSGSYVVTADTPEGDNTVDIGLGTSAVNGMEQTIANEDSAPAGVTFSKGPLSLPDLPAGEHKAVWCRWTINAGATAVPATSPTLTASGQGT